jgi:hypothetical protein
MIHGGLLPNFFISQKVSIGTLDRIDPALLAMERAIFPMKNRARLAFG